MADRPEIDYKDTDLQVIYGDDPCIVCLHDASLNRTFAPNEWYWCFGDKTTYCGFELPGDNKLVTDYPGHEFGESKVESLQSLLNIIGKNDFAMYPTSASLYGTSLGDTVHYTGIYLRASNRNSLANPNETDTHREAGTYNDPVEKSTINVPAERCGKTTKTAEKYTDNTCGGQDVWGNGVYHIYKGAGVYPVYMSSWTRAGGDNNNTIITNRIGYTPMENGAIPSGDKLVNYGVVVVKPRCPCFYGFEPVTNEGEDLRCIGITDPNYSCRGNTRIDAVTGYLEPVGPDELISAYAPFMQVGVSGKIIPMSFPIDRIYWDWCDWFTDFDDANTVTNIELDGEARGWDGHWLGENQSFIPVSGSHVYTMPGLYSLYFDYDYLTGSKPGHDYSDVADAIKILDMFTEESCTDQPALRNKFMLVEIPPRFTGQIIIGDRQENESGTELTINGITVKDVLVAGSYPIERIDWDFGDGTPIFTLYKNDYIDDLTRSDEWDFADKSTSGTHCPEGTGFTFLNGCSAGLIYEPFVEDYTIQHTYYRTNVDTGYMYTISCTAYAENTHTSAATSITIKGFENPYPSFDKIEGEVRVVDTRNYGGPDDTIIVFNSSNSGELYHVKVEDQ